MDTPQSVTSYPAMENSVEKCLPKITLQLMGEYVAGSSRQRTLSSHWNSFTEGRLSDNIQLLLEPQKMLYTHYFAYVEVLTLHTNGVAL